MDPFDYESWRAAQFGTAYTSPAPSAPAMPPRPLVVPGEAMGMGMAPPLAAPVAEMPMAAPPMAPPAFAPAERPALPEPIAEPQQPGFFDQFTNRWNGPPQATATPPMTPPAMSTPTGFGSDVPPMPAPTRAPGESPYDTAMRARGMRRPTAHESAYAQRYPRAMDLLMMTRRARQQRGY
jgi:hypothetical protein